MKKLVALISLTLIAYAGIPLADFVDAWHRHNPLTPVLIIVVVICNVAYCLLPFIWTWQRLDMVKDEKGPRQYEADMKMTMLTSMVIFVAASIPFVVIFYGHKAFMGYLIPIGAAMLFSAILFLILLLTLIAIFVHEMKRQWLCGENDSVLDKLDAEGNIQDITSLAEELKISVNEGASHIHIPEKLWGSFSPYQFGRFLASFIWQKIKGDDQPIYRDLCRQVCCKKRDDYVYSNKDQVDFINGFISRHPEFEKPINEARQDILRSHQIGNQTEKTAARQKAIQDERKAMVKRLNSGTN